MSDGNFPSLISKNDELNSIDNPIFIQSVDTPPPAPEVITPVHGYKPSVLALNATANHDYVVVGTKFKLRSVLAASTNNCKFEVQVGPVGSLVSKAVIMTGTNSRTEQADFNPPIEVSFGEIVRVIQKNIQSGHNDLYSTIMGDDIA